MRKLLTLLLVAGVLAVPMSASASIWMGGVNNRIDFLNWEGLGVDTDGDGKLDVGDTLRGVLQAQDLAAGLSGLPAVFLIGPGNPSLTGIFEIEVTKKTPAAGGTFLFEFGPNSAFATRNSYSAGAMLVLYEEFGPTAQDFSIASGTFLGAEATVTDGTLVGEWGFTGVSPGYWVSQGIDTVAADGGSAEFFYGVNYLAGTSFAPGDIIPQTTPFINAGDPRWGGFTGLLNDMVGEGDITPMGADAVGVYNTFSEDPAMVNVIPEPASMITWSLLLGCALGFGWMRRRRA